jgi:ABC-type ATPase involved in cell division/GNAT superfamily N-acetyltransferase
MKLSATVSSPAFGSYRSARVRSLFNVSEDQGSSHSISIDAPLDEKEWQIGLVVGASGTGKTTLGSLLFGGGKVHKGFEWDSTKPIIDEIGEGKDFNSVTASLAGVGLGSVPSWLRPYHVLSMGEKFRAEMARVIIEEPEEIVIDEFTSVIDRQIAQVGSSAFSKAWRRTSGKAILLSCHYDIIDWLCPDWIIDTNDWSFQWRCLRRRPEVPIDIYEARSAAAWRFFKPHHYLDLPLPVAATYYIAEYNGAPVAHLAVATSAGLKSARFTRLVVLPEWQGAGVGVKFLEFVAQKWLDGENRYTKRMTGIIHTSHPALVHVLNKSPKWDLFSQQMGGGDRGKSMETLMKSARAGRFKGSSKGSRSGYGGHLRAVAGFRYIGEQK